jgi:hypothetical protein
MKKSKVFLTIPQYANHRGKDQNAVRYAIKTGKISSHKKGPKKEILIDRDAADMEWVPRANPREEVFQPPTNAPFPTVVLGPSSNKDDDNFDEDDDEMLLVSVAKFRAKKEKYDAELAKIKVDKEKGKLIDAKETEARWNQVASITRTKVLGIPSKSRQRMPELTDLQYSILEMIVREALEELASENVTAEHN